MNDKIISEKNKLTEALYNKASKIKSDKPVKEYVQMILLKQEFNLPLTKTQADLMAMIQE